MKTNLVKTKLKKGDQVVVTAGRSKGATGKVEHIDRKNGKVFVAGANIYKKHIKPSAQNPDGGIIDKPMPLDISNVNFLDPKTNKATRLGYQVGENAKIRVTKASGSKL